MLKWNGSGFLPGVPARDLTDEEVKQYGGEQFLLNSGVYDASTTPAASLSAPQKEKNTHKVEVKDGRN